MLIQIATLVKPLRTLVTRIWLFTCVETRMNNKIGLLLKLFVTDMTSNRIVSNMGHLVSLESSLISKGLVADITGIEVLILVDNLLVPSQIMGTTEGLITIQAIVIEMLMAVEIKKNLVQEQLTTTTTWISLLPYVHCQEMVL